MLFYLIQDNDLFIIYMVRMVVIMGFNRVMIVVRLV